MVAITTLARAFGGGSAPKPVRGFLIPLIPPNDTPDVNAQRSFQYFPASLQDQHATNYQPKQIPGLSHPLYQWTSGGARTISFEAIFTRDRTYSAAEQNAIDSAGQSAATGSNIAAFSGAPTLQYSGFANPDDVRNVDIPSAVAWLRSFVLPEYGSGATPQRPFPPRKLILGLPGVRLNWGVPALSNEEIYCIMTQCEVNYEGFFADGTPRIAKVALGFAEIIQVGGRITVQDGSVKRAMALAGYGLNDKRKGT